MSHTTINASDLQQMLTFAAEEIASEEARLNSLDAAIGDGDHGITMRVGFNAVNSRLKTLPSGVPVDAVLREAGMAFMGATGGAIGVLLGKMLMSAGTALKGRQEIGPQELMMVLESMEIALSGATKAMPGDKTILDAVHAAHQAIAEGQDSQSDLIGLLTRASLAAQKAAKDTAHMFPRAGRASRLGNRALGHPDPGAVSFSVILRSMATWLAHNTSGGSSVQ
jgi:dihydroxyacetone kinase phosphoprotein-dependent L subunit